MLRDEERLFRPKQAPQAAIDMAPLVDVVFLLIIFLMLGARFARPSLEVDLPVAKNGRARQWPQTVSVSISRGGDVTVGNRLVRPEDLTKTLRASLTDMRSGRVIIRADSRASVSGLVRVLDAARAAGARGVDVEHSLASRSTP